VAIASHAVGDQPRLRRRFFLGLAVVLAIAVFVADILLPPTIDSFIPYVAVVLIGIWLPNHREVVAIAIGCTALATIGHFLVPDFDLNWSSASNRSLEILLIWIATVVVALCKRDESGLLATQEALERQVEERTSHLRSQISKTDAARLASLESEERLRKIMDTAVDGIITFDDQGIIESFNPAAERIFGYARGEVLGRNVSMLMPEPHRINHHRYLGDYIGSELTRAIGVGRDVTGLRKDGTSFTLDLALSEIRADDRIMFTGIIRDITQRREAERQVAMLATFLVNIGDAIEVTDADGCIEYVNPAHEAITGYSPADIIGRMNTTPMSMMQFGGQSRPGRPGAEHCRASGRTGSRGIKKRRSRRSATMRVKFPTTSASNGISRNRCSPARRS
jgi:PAS domain S-box-containing protein